MASNDFLQTRAALKKGVIRQVGSDTPIAIRLKYKGTGSVTSVTTTTATSIVMVTSDGGTDTYLFATYTTIGALVDAINADGIFEAKVLDSVRAEATASQFVDGAITAATDVRDGDGGTLYYDVLVDTDAADYFAARLTFDYGFDKAETKKKHRVHMQEIKYLMNLGTAGTVYMYEVDGTTETEVFKEAAVDNSATSITWASGEAKYTANEGNDLVVYIPDTGNLADASTNYLRVIGEQE